jgi:hypothetical protein
MPSPDLSAQEFLLSDPLCLGYVNAVTDLQRQGELGNNITVRTTADILREPGMSIERRYTYRQLRKRNSSW